MKCSLVLLTIQLTFIGLLMAGNVHSQNLNQKIALKLEGKTIKESLVDVQMRSGIPFVLPAKLMNNQQKKVSITARDITIKEAIDEILKATNLRYKVVEGYIVIDAKPIPQQPGRISGKIVDDRGETLPGASIKIIETGQTLQTSVDGTYNISIKPGSYTLEISYISFQTQRITGVVIIEGKSTALNIAMKADAKGLEEVVVTSTYQKASVAALYVEQQNRAVVSDGISAQQISATPDKNVGESLKRITGVSTTDNRKVVVRGIAERYNVALLNGSSLPSTDIQERDFEFNLIPTNMVEHIVVAKSITPDMPYGFAGGLVQISTKSVPANNFLSITAGTSFNSLTTGKDFMGYQRGKYDYLGFDDGGRKDHFPKGLIAIPYGSGGGFDPRQMDAENTIKAAQVAEQNRRIGGTERLGARTYQAMPSQNYQMSIGRAYSLSKIRVRNLGFVGSLTYRNTQSNDYIANMRRGTWSQSRVNDPYDEEDVNTGNLYGFNTTIGALLNGGFKTEKHQINIYNLYTRIFDNQFSRITGWTQESPKNFDTSIFPIIREDERPKFSDLLQNKLSGSHKLGEIRIEWNTARTHLKTAEQDAASALLTSREFGNKAPLFEYTNGSATAPENGSTHRDQYIFKERNLSAELSLAYDFKLGKTAHTFKTGANYMDKHASYDWNILPIVSVSNFYRNNIPVQQWGNYMGMDDKTKYLYYRPGVYSLSSFEGKSVNKGVFAMVDSKLLPSLRIVGGVRADYFKLDTIKNGASESVVYTNYKVMLLDSIRLRWLPSVNITYTPFKNVNVRASYGESMVRPGLMENSQFVRFSPNYGTVLRSRGVESTHIKNYDAKLEWFPAAGEIISAGYFYKYFDKPAEYYAYDQSNTGRYDILITNSDWAKVKGWEFELRKSLGFIYDGLPFLKDVYASGNLTLQKSEVRARDRQTKQLTNGTDSVYYTYLKYPRALYGQIPRQYNLGMQYSGKRLGLNLVYNYMGYKTFVTGSSPVYVEYERPRAQLDAQISYKFLKGKMETKLNVSNLTDAAHRFFVNGAIEYQPGMEKPENRPSSGEWSDLYRYKEGFSEKFEEGYINEKNEFIGDRQTFTRYVGRTFSFSVSYNF